MKADTRPPWPQLTDDSPMPFGEHKGKKMVNVDPEYLLYIYDMPWIKKWPAVEEYIESNIQVLLAEQTRARKQKKPYGCR